MKLAKYLIIFGIIASVVHCIALITAFYLTVSNSVSG